MIDNPRIFDASEQIQLRLAKAGIRCAIGVKLVAEWMVFTAILDGGKTVSVQVSAKDFAKLPIRNLAESATIEVQSALAEDRN